MTKRFYVYCLFRPWNGEPCYVGKGSGDRYLKHFAMGGSHPNKHLSRIIARAGGELPVVILHADLAEATAFAYERALITAIGRANKRTGPLANMTDGGEGTSGHVHVVTPEQAERIRQSKLGKPRSAETRAKLSAAGKGKRLSDEALGRLSASLKSSSKAAAHIEDLAKRHRGKKLTAEHREKVRQANLGAKRSEAARAAMSEGQRRRIHKPLSPEALARRREKTKDHVVSPERREQVRQQMIAEHARRRAMRNNSRTQMSLPL